MEQNHRYVLTVLKVCKNPKNSDTGKIFLEEQSDLGLHCLHRPVCPITQEHYGNHTFLAHLSRQAHKVSL